LLPNPKTYVTLFSDLFNGRKILQGNI
jgi:hypothetical protein